MPYIKTNKAGVERKVELTEYNVYTECEQCGCETQVTTKDFEMAFDCGLSIDEVFSFCCRECKKQYVEEVKKDLSLTGILIKKKGK